MSRAFSYCGTSPKEIQAVREHWQAQFALAFVEQLDRVAFLPENEVLSPQTQDLDVRLFGDQVELRWRYDAPHWHALLITDNEADIAPEGFQTEPTLHPMEGVSCALWGERNKSGDRTRFREGQRLPIELTYPGVPPTTDYAAVRMKLYMVEGDTTPLPTVVRYVALEPASTP